MLTNSLTHTLCSKTTDGATRMHTHTHTHTHTSKHPPTHTHKYRLYHEVEVSTWFTHRGCVNHVGTDTEWYNRLVPWATWPWQRIYGLATIALAIKGSSAYLATVQTIVADHHRTNPMPDVDNSSFTESVLSNSGYFFVIQNHDAIVAVYNLKPCCCVDSNSNSK